jgi:hypothetical protein
MSVKMKDKADVNAVETWEGEGKGKGEGDGEEAPIS